MYRRTQGSKPRCKETNRGLTDERNKMGRKGRVWYFACSIRLLSFSVPPLKDFEPRAPVALPLVCLLILSQSTPLGYKRTSSGSAVWWCGVRRNHHRQNEHRPNWRDAICKPPQSEDSFQLSKPSSHQAFLRSVRCEVCVCVWRQEEGWSGCSRRLVEVVRRLVQ